MQKEELLRAILQVKEEWEETIAALGVEGLERPDALEGLRVRDVLAIFNGWDRWNLVQLRCAFTGEEPSTEELDGGIAYPARETFSLETMNAMYVAGGSALALEEVLRHWREISGMRAAWVTEASQERLEALVGADWSGASSRVWRLVSEVPGVSDPMAVWQVIYDQVELQRSHLADVRRWMIGGNK